MFENIDTSLIDWSRAQFALTAMYHWLFVPLTLGLAVIMGLMETFYVTTGKEFWKNTAKFWMKLFGINFAVGVATGLILEFEFGTNWSNYSWFVGDIFGAPLAIEGILAFFMEATFIAVMFFGWNKVSKRFHLASTWLTGLGATISAWWILVANAWMQYPVGMAFNPETVRNEMVDFAAVALSPMAIAKFFHTVLSSWILGAVFVVGISCWYLLRNRQKEFALSSIKVAAAVGLFASLVTAWTGDISGVQVAKVQPMKMAAAEGLHDGGNGVPFTIAGDLKIPKMLSILATHDIDGYVPGINNLLEGWIETTGAIGIVCKSGRYGGTYAHSDIAFEFASWISAEFKLYIIKDYKRLKADENSRFSLNWNLNSEISKLNYKIHTDAIKENLIPPELTPAQISFTYANEADMLNVVLFGRTTAGSIFATRNFLS